MNKNMFYLVLFAIITSFNILLPAGVRVRMVSREKIREGHIEYSKSLGPKPITYHSALTDKEVSTTVPVGITCRKENGEFTCTIMSYPRREPQPGDILYARNIEGPEAEKRFKELEAEFEKEEKEEKARERME